MRRHVLITSLCLAVLSCGCSSGGNGSIQGTVGGATFSPADAVFYPLPPTTTAIAIVSTSGVCDYFSKHEHVKNEFALAIYFEQTAATVGTFDVSQLAVAWDVSDATCNIASQAATSGTVKLTSVTAQSIDGTFDLFFDQDHITGSFHASHCDPQVDASTPATCT